MIFRYGQLVPLEETEVELKLAPGRDDLTACPGMYWQERGVQFVVCKIPEDRYRSYFFYTDEQQYRIGERDYDDIETCLRELLRLQADHHARRQALMSMPAGDDEDHFPPIII